MTAPPSTEDVADSEDDVLAFMGSPQKHWRQLHSINPLERQNREIRRRTDVVGILPNDASVRRLVTMLLVEQNDQWAVGRRYFSKESMAPATTRPLRSLGDDLRNVEIVIHLAPMLAEAGRERQAVALFRRATALACNAPMLRVNFGTFMGQLGHLDEAERLLTKVIEELRLANDADADADAGSNVIGHAECMRARVSLETGDPQLALERARTLLTDALLWDAASEAVSDAAQLRGRSEPTSMTTSADSMDCLTTRVRPPRNPADHDAHRRGGLRGWASAALLPGGVEEQGPARVYPAG